MFVKTKPSSVTANLLYIAIFANTLNFNASVTTQRDVQAFEKLKKFIDLPKNWIEQYYSEVEKCIFENFDKAMKNDTKILSNGWAIAQIELYDAASILKNQNFLESLKLCMNDHSDWLLTMPSISEGRNYLVTNTEKVKRIISEKINSDWDGFDAKTQKLYLHKEIW